MKVVLKSLKKSLLWRNHVRNTNEPMNVDINKQVISKVATKNYKSQNQSQY